MRLWQSHAFDVVMSLATFTEMKTVLERAEIQRYLPVVTGEAFLNLLLSRASWVQPDLRAPQCRDPEDASLIAPQLAAKRTI